MSAPYWQLRETAPYWRLADLRQGRRPRRKPKVEIYRALPSSLELIERAGGGEAPAVLELKFAIYGKWQEITDAHGHYLERLNSGVFRKSLKERFAGIRAVLSHGKDPSLGATVLGKIKEIKEGADGAIARVALFPSVPPLLLDGLRDGVYGASFRGDPIKSETNWHPGISAHNPDGIPEITRLEIRLRDIGPTPFAAYPGTTAMVAASAAGESLPARSLPMEQLDSEHALLDVGPRASRRRGAGLEASAKGARWPYVLQGLGQSPSPRCASTARRWWSAWRDSDRERSPGWSRRASGCGWTVLSSSHAPSASACA